MTVCGRPLKAAAHSGLGFVKLIRGLGSANTSLSFIINEKKVSHGGIPGLIARFMHHNLWNRDGLPAIHNLNSRHLTVGNEGVDKGTQRPFLIVQLNQVEATQTAGNKLICKVATNG